MMKERLQKLAAATALILSPLMAATHAAEVLYQNDLEKEDLGFEPLEFLVLEGRFEVKQEKDNRVMNLPGSPIGRFGYLFGPTETDGVEAQARIFGSRKGNLFPTFGVGLNGVSGYRLLCAQGRRSIELRKDSVLLASAPLKWASDTWTQFRLQVIKLGDGSWKVRGKLWEQGNAEPAKWQVEHVEKEEPTPGRAAVWAWPFSDKPIKSDDVKVVRVSK